MKLLRKREGAVGSVAGLPLQVWVKSGRESIRHLAWWRKRVGGSKVEGVKMDGRYEYSTVQ